MHSRDQEPPAISEAQVLTRATIIAGERLGLNEATLAATIGVSEESIDRLRRFEDLLRKGTDPCERALLLIRLFRSLNAGRDAASACAWMQQENEKLGGRPVVLITGRTGLCAVVDLLQPPKSGTTQQGGLSSGSVPD